MGGGGRGLANADVIRGRSMLTGEGVKFAKILLTSYVNAPYAKLQADYWLHARYLYSRDAFGLKTSAASDDRVLYLVYKIIGPRDISTMMGDTFARPIKAWR